jgi:hypothetical protein
MGVINLFFVLGFGWVLKKIGKYGFFIMLSGILTVIKYIFYLVIPNCPQLYKTD